MTLRPTIEMILGPDDVLAGFLTTTWERQATQAGYSIDRYSTDDDPDALTHALDAARTPALFGPGRAVHLTTDTWDSRIIVDQVHVTGPLLIRCRSAGRAAAALRTSGITLHDVPHPTTPTFRGWLQRVSASAGVTVDREVSRLITERLSGDPERVGSLLRTAQAGMPLTADLVAKVTHGAGSSAPAWTSVDAAFAGDLITAWAQASRSEPILVLHTCATRIAAAGLAAESPASGASRTGNPAAARRAAADARAVGSSPALVTLLHQALYWDAVAKNDRGGLADPPGVDFPTVTPAHAAEVMLALIAAAVRQRS